MRAIVNHFPIRAGADWHEFSAKVAALVDEVA